MRILHLITRLDGGGSAVNTLLSATAQAAEGHLVVVGCGESLESAMGPAETATLNDLLARLHAAGGEVRRLPHLRRAPGLHDLFALLEIRRLIGEGFDLVHTHTSKAGALGRLAAWYKVAAVVHTPHGHVFHNYFSPLTTRIYILIERYLSWHCDALVALTRAERDDHLALGIGHPGQWRIIPSGVDVAGIRARVAELRRQQSGERWLAISVGRLEPVKGMDRLVRAWALVVRAQPEARLAIVGDGAEREFLQRLAAEYGVGERIDFLGYADPVPILASSRLFVLLSRNEGMGRVVVEAMAAGLPCVVNEVCGLSELVDAAVGSCVDAEDADAVAAAILSDWPSSQRDEARRRAERYSTDSMVAALRQLYRQVMHG